MAEQNKKSEDARENESSMDGEKKEGAPTKSKKILFLSIFGGIIFFGLGGGLLYYFLQPPGVPEKPNQLKDIRFVYHHELPDILVNLKTKGDMPRFLKLKIILEGYDPNDGKHLKVLESLQPRVIDQFQSFLRDLYLEDIEGAKGVQLLREELLKRVNLIMRPEEISNILFREILVQ